MNKKLEPIYKELKTNNIEKSNINIIIDSEPSVIENKEDQKLAKQMIKNFKANNNEKFREYYTKLENRVKVKDEIFIKELLKNVKDDIKYLSKEEKIKLEEKLKHNPLSNRRDGRKLKTAYDRLYKTLEKQGIQEPELNKEASKAFIYSKIAKCGFTEIIDNRKMMTKKLDILLKKYSVDKKEIRLKLLQNKPTNVEEADKHLINQILQTTKNELGKLYNSKDFIKYLNYNSQNKSKMVNVYNKIYFEISKLEKNQNKLKLETSKAFIYAKIGTEGFKQMENNNECSDEYLENVIKYYKKGFEIIKQDFLNGKLDFSKRVLYTKSGIRKRML